MKKLIGRIQKDLNNFQTTLQKESTDFIDKVKNVDLKSNLDSARKEIGKLLSTKLKKIEPSYSNCVKELHKNAKKAGIDLGRIETEIKKRADVAQTKIKSTTRKTKDTLMNKGKTATTKAKKTTTTAAAGKKTATATKSPRRKTKSAT
jgi:hypothetical protein